MANDLSALDAAITKIGTDVTAIVAEVVALIAKVQANPGGDYTTEVTALQSMASSLETSIAAAKAVTGS